LAFRQEKDKSKDMKHFKPEDIILEDSQGEDAYDFPKRATNILLENIYGVHLTSDYDEEGDTYYNLTTLIPNNDLILTAQPIKGLDISELYTNGDAPTYTKDSARIENLSLEEVVLIMNAILELKEAASPRFSNAVIARNAYVVALEEERLNLFPITQFKDVLLDPETGNQIPNDNGQPTGFQGGPL